MHRNSLPRFVLLCLLALLATPSMASAGESKEGQFVASDGVKLHYYLLGNKGSWVVLMHGYTDSAERMWIKTGIAHALAKDHRVLAFDHRNHGKSDRPQPNGFGRADDAIELMDHFKIQKAHIHGYSMGGGFVGRLMAEQPQRFLTATFGGSGIQETDEKLRASAAALDAPMPEPLGAEATAFQNLRDRSAAFKQSSTTNGALQSPAPIPDLRSIAFPVLAINGEYDRPYSKTQRLWRELPNFQNVILSKKNHVSAIMVGGPMPQEYIDALVRFVNANDAK